MKHQELIFDRMIEIEKYGISYEVKEDTLYVREDANTFHAAMCILNISKLSKSELNKHLDGMVSELEERYGA